MLPPVHNLRPSSLTWASQVVDDFFFHHNVNPWALFHVILHIPPAYLRIPAFHLFLVVILLSCLYTICHVVRRQGSFKTARNTSKRPEIAPRTHFHSQTAHSEPQNPQSTRFRLSTTRFGPPTTCFEPHKPSNTLFQTTTTHFEPEIAQTALFWPQTAQSTRFRPSTTRFRHPTIHFQA